MYGTLTQQSRVGNPAQVHSDTATPKLHYTGVISVVFTGEVFGVPEVWGAGSSGVWA